MSGAREEILARVRAAQGRPSATPAPPIPRDYLRGDGRSQDQLVALFCQRADDYSAEVERIPTHSVAEAILAAAARHRARRFAIAPQLPRDWRPQELELNPDASLSARQLDRLDGVITGCTVAIAETGTIALSAAPHEGRRRLSLVPDLHVCLVNAPQIVGTVPEAITRLAEIVRDQRRPLTLISGPSATSDIELERVEGVHGPRRLVVLVIEGEEPG